MRLLSKLALSCLLYKAGQLLTALTETYGGDPKMRGNHSHRGCGYSPARPTE